MAAIEALIGIQNYIPKNALGFEKKRDLVFSLLSRIKNLECYKPEGAFYLFIRCMKLFGKKTPSGKLLKNDNDVATYLLENKTISELFKQSKDTEKVAVYAV